MSRTISRSAVGRKIVQLDSEGYLDVDFENSSLSTKNTVPELNLSLGEEPSKKGLLKKGRFGSSEPFHREILPVVVKE
jgi:hypothetical protein